jgi:4-aminobutyrate aminotransferase
VNDASEGDLNTSVLRAAWDAGHDAPTRSLLDRDAAAFLHQALSTPCLDAIVHAEGAWLTTVGGRRLLDFHGNSVHQVGHAHPEVVAAVRAQLDALAFCPRRFTCEVAVRLAETLAALAPDPLGKVLLAPSGAAAVGIALKLARVATGRHRTVSMWGAFHGAGLDTISIGGEALFSASAGPLLPGAEHVPPPGLARRFFGDDANATVRLADYIDYVLASQGDVAAVIAEPMRWTTVDPPPPGFWPKVRASCDRHGALLIFDEIPSALGRTGSFFAFEQAGCIPDMVVLGKGLGGGVFPQAALIARRDLDVASHLALGHYTHEKSPLGAAAALATIAVIERDGLIARARALGPQVAADLTRLQARHPCVAAVRHLGAVWAVELRALGGRSATELAERVLYASLRRGLSFKVGGGSVICLCPPLTIAEPDLTTAIAILDDSFAEGAGAPEGAF